MQYSRARFVKMCTTLFCVTSHERLEKLTTVKTILLRSHILVNALVRLPKLCRIVFIDFGELAREGENYSLICKRVFGNTLEPFGLSFFDDTCREFVLLIDFIAKHRRAGIRSLLIGGHSYKPFVDFWATTENFRRHLHRPSESARHAS